LNIPPGSKVLLFVGRLDPQKDPLRLLNTVPILRKTFPGLHLLFVGDGILKSELHEAIRRQGLEGCVHILGWRADVPSLLKAADALVLCSLWEGMPNVVLEAFAAGILVVATQVEGVSELIVHRETGLLVGSGTSEDLTRTLLEALQDPAGSTKMGSRAQNLVKERFTWEKMAKTYTELYQSLLANRWEG
jgi:starch synthase (maltosyl-transferring)